MTSYTVLIVDDEPLARQRLARLLQEHGDFSAVGEAGHGDAALAYLNTQAVDVVLLDIQMPGRNGLEVAAQIQQLKQPPLIIFCTAFEQHALAAFGVDAVDYLLKPVRPEDLSRALNRVKERLFGRVAHTEPARTHISAQTHKGLELIALVDIYACLAEQKYVTVLHAGGETLIDESLKQLEEQFPDLFIRAHRNALVAKQKIIRLEALAAGGHQLHLQNLNQPIPVSRRQLAELKQLMKQL